MRSYLMEAVDDFDKQGLKLTKTLVKINLFNIDADSSLVGEKDRIKFYSIVMKLMRMSYRERITCN